MPSEQPRQDPKVKEFFYNVRHLECSRVKRLLKEKTISPDIQDKHCELLPTALNIAAELNSAEMAQVLIAAKPKPADVNAVTADDRRPIWWAAKHGNKELAGVLLRGGQCEVNVIDKASGCSPLFRAVMSNSAEVVQQIINAGGDVNQRRLGVNVGFETPLIKAVQLNNKEICECLINSLCNIQAKTEVGLTALHFAVAYNRYEICELLLQNRIKINVATKYGVTAMTVAIEHHNAAMVSLLIKYDYKLDKRYKWKETPLEQAINIQAEQCAIALIHGGCCLDPHRGKRSYFYMAVDAKMTHVVKLLAEIKPTYLNEQWIQSRLWPVSIYRRPDICKWLLKLKNEPNSLMKLCRAKIFFQLGKHPTSKVSLLSLPEKLKEFLQYTDLINKKIFEPTSTDDQMCPYYCPVPCSRADCPELDISSESDTDILE
ncbi:ankyrin repeat and SOCS box protein 2-like [Gigantopelta aegis]|uniref:ankyrin repeat and SOCS box protein 2-like n=1 Tax=Gigantopelta aegis TaxID=1735272 RepID=UPI001B88E0B9|nr:ankyrin repeat and SOCS box protein 2-like [Gigantopelta aegis]